MTDITREIITTYIADGEFDEAVYDRFCNSNKMIDRYCDSCDKRCSDTCEGRRYRI